MPRTKASIKLREQWLHKHYLEHLLLDRRYPYRLRQPSPLALAAAYNRKVAACSHRHWPLLPPTISLRVFWPSCCDISINTWYLTDLTIQHINTCMTSSPNNRELSDRKSRLGAWSTRALGQVLYNREFLISTLRLIESIQDGEIECRFSLLILKTHLFNACKNFVVERKKSGTVKIIPTT